MKGFPAAFYLVESRSGDSSVGHLTSHFILLRIKGICLLLHWETKKILQEEDVSPTSLKA